MIIGAKRANSVAATPASQRASVALLASGANSVSSELPPFHSTRVIRRDDRMSRTPEPVQSTPRPALPLNSISPRDDLRAAAAEGAGAVHPHLAVGGVDRAIHP